MNYEPRHRAAPGDSKHDSNGRDLEPERSDEALVDALAADAPTAEAAAQLHRLFRDNGEPFAAYLALDDVDPYVPDLDVQYLSAYLGRYTDRESLIVDTIATFGWELDLNRLLAGDPQLRAVVTLDRDAIWSLATDHYEIVTASNDFYVFDRY